MPGTITKDLTDIDLAEATTNWIINLGTWSTPTPVANADMMVQGNAAIVGRVTGTGGAPSVKGYLVAKHAGLNLTTGAHLFLWVKTVTWPGMDTKANGGIRCVVSSDAAPTVSGDGLTNSRSWNLDGKDTESVAGWKCYAVDPQSAGSISDIGTPAINSLKALGFRAAVLSAIGAGSFRPANIMGDAVRYGYGIFVRDGTAGAPVNMASIYAADSSGSNAWGITTLLSGIYYLAGKYKLGDASQAAVTYFKDTNQVLVYQDFPVNSSFYEWLLAGHASYNTTVQLGNYAGGVASDGFTIRGSGAAIWTLTVGANSLFKAYSSVFSQLKQATLNANCELRGCTVSDSGTITPNGAVITNTTFQSLRTALGTNALVINSKAQMDAVTNCNFFGCNRAIRITQAGNYDFVGLKFSGNAFDIENTSGSTVVISCDANSNPTTYTGSLVTFVQSATLKIQGLKTSTEVRVYSHGTQTELAGEEDVNDGEFLWNYNPATVSAVDIQIINVDYEAIWLDNIVLPSGGLTMPMQQQIDRQYKNPS
jgi:hypothetical protein